MLEIGEEYVLNPPFGDRVGRRARIVEKADEARKTNIEALFPHHANGKDWYKIATGQWGREDWFER